MKYAVVYSSKTGNTKILAEKLRELLCEKELVYFGGISEEALSADYVFVGFWTDKGSCDEATKAFLPKLNGKKAALFGTAGFGKDKAYFEQILHRVEELIPSNTELTEGFMCAGKMPQAVRDRYEKMSEADPQNSKFIDMLENLDSVANRPNNSDLENLELWIRKNFVKPVQKP